MITTRYAFRAVPRLQHSVRHYATEGSSPGGTNKWVRYGGGAVGVFVAIGVIRAIARGDPREGVEVDYKKYTGQKQDSNSDKPANKTFKGGDQGWLDLKLESVEELSHNTKKFRFALPDKDDKYPTGPMSSHLHDMEPPQRLEFKGPIPKYPWSPNKHDHICLIAGGTGITPMYQLCRAIFNNPSDKTKVTLVFGNVSEEDILLKREFEDLENTYPQRFRAFYMLDKPSEKWIGGTGYINYDLLKKVLPEPKVENIKIFVCGPPGLYKAISGPKKSPQDQGDLSGLLKELGYQKDQVYKF
ncbi:MAG: hypothetical protein Q9200_007622 [Gallowayella weberi]